MYLVLPFVYIYFLFYALYVRCTGNRDKIIEQFYGSLFAVKSVLKLYSGKTLDTIDTMITFKAVVMTVKYAVADKNYLVLTHIKGFHDGYKGLLEQIELSFDAYCGEKNMADVMRRVGPAVLRIIDTMSESLPEKHRRTSQIAAMKYMKDGELAKDIDSSMDDKYIDTLLESLRLYRHEVDV